MGAVLEVNVFGNSTTVQRPSPSGYQAMAIPAATLSDVCVDHALEVQFMAHVPAPAAAALGDRHVTCRRTATESGCRSGSGEPAGLGIEAVDQHHSGREHLLDFL